MQQPFDIIILAGQSNAVGYGCGETEYSLQHMDQVSVLYDDQPEDYAKDENGKEYMAIYEPWKIKMIEATAGYTGSLAMRFADAYIEKFSKGWKFSRIDRSWRNRILQRLVGRGTASLPPNGRSC